MAPDGSTTAMVREGWDHLRARRPLAAWACWQRALRLGGEIPSASQALERLANSGDLPAAARAEYRLRAPSDPARRAAWDDGLRDVVDDLPAMADAFGRLASDRPDDASAWYNRALCLAWIGNNREAIAALDRVLEIEARSASDPAVAAWTLAEVLRAGGGAEDLADDLRFSCTLPWDPALNDDLLREFPDIQRLPTPRAPVGEAAADVEVVEWLDRPMPEIDESRPVFGIAAELPIVLASVMVIPTSRALRLSSPRVETLRQAEEALLGRLGIGPGAENAVRREAEPLPWPFLDADVWTVRIPPVSDPAIGDDLRREWVEHYYEDLWIQRPRQGLGGRTPLEAAEAARRGDTVVSAKLAAVVGFREQLGRRPAAARLYCGYPFDRLRRRLGLAPADPDAVDTEDLSCAPPWELAAMDPAALDDRRLLDALASAVGLLDDSLTAALGAELLRRRVPVAGSSLVGAVAPIVRRAMDAGDSDAALDAIGRVRPLADAATAEILDVWKAEILARTGRAEESSKIYKSLVRPDARGAVMALDGALTLLDNGHHDEARPLLHAASDLSRSRGLRWTGRRAMALLDGSG